MIKTAPRPTTVIAGFPSTAALILAERFARYYNIRNLNAHYLRGVISARMALRNAANGQPLREQWNATHDLTGHFAGLRRSWGHPRDSGPPEVQVVIINMNLSRPRVGVAFDRNELVRAGVFTMAAVEGFGLLQNCERKEKRSGGTTRSSLLLLAHGAYAKQAEVKDFVAGVRASYGGLGINAEFVGLPYVFTKEPGIVPEKMVEVAEMCWRVHHCGDIGVANGR